MLRARVSPGAMTAVGLLASSCALVLGALYRFRCDPHFTCSATTSLLGLGFSLACWMRPDGMLACALLAVLAGCPLGFFLADGSWARLLCTRPWRGDAHLSPDHASEAGFSAFLVVQTRGTKTRGTKTRGTETRGAKTRGTETGPTPERSCGERHGGTPDDGDATLGEDEGLAGEAEGWHVLRPGPPEEGGWRASAADTPLRAVVDAGAALFAGLIETARFGGRKLTQKDAR